ncbi:DUF1345 domain-containing protein [Microbacterium sp. X-17]|uniref:DUF1345 domain-containing protein n=1 Tax=Microbacterium sp. X-17 TaxID=3144404 RepID=UPI0031F587B1
MSPRRRVPFVLRVSVAIVAGVLIAVAVTFALGLAAGLLAGWASFAGVLVVWALVLTWRMDALDTRAHATEEDPGRQGARLVSVIGSLASLGAVGFVLLQARNETRPTSFILAAIALLAVATSWALIQTDYMLRYARVYYRDPIGGIDFNQIELPMYTDFAYFSVSLGMTYQVSDSNVGSNEIRRMVIGQTLLSYLFGAVILASVVNLFAGLGG